MSTVALTSNSFPQCTDEIAESCLHQVFYHFSNAILTAHRGGTAGGSQEMEITAPGGQFPQVPTLQEVQCLSQEHIPEESRQKQTTDFNKTA